MEPEAGNSMIISIDQTAITPHEEPKEKVTRSSRKNRKGSKNIFKVALFMLRRRSRKPKLLVEDESKSVWRKIVGSIRPLHLQTSQSPLADNNENIPQSKTMITSTPFANGVDPGDDVFDSASDITSSPSPVSSRYASAVGLNEMVQEEENEKEVVKEEKNEKEVVKEEEENEKEDVKEEENEREDVKEKNNDDDDDNDGEGDEMIDAKAEEFIAQFYHQMRLQRFDVVDSHYHEMSMRSLGL